MCSDAYRDPTPALPSSHCGRRLNEPLWHLGISIPWSSIRELAHSLHSHPRPPLAASIYLLFEQQRLLGVCLPGGWDPLAITSHVFPFLFFFIHAVHLFDRWNALQLLIDRWTKAVTFFLSPLSPVSCNECIRIQTFIHRPPWVI